MKNQLPFSITPLVAFGLLVVTFIGYSQTTYVPDSYFENALINLGLDDVEDDYVLTSNINTVTNLDVSGSSISNLTGIEDFVALTNLNCSSNNLSNLDISNNTALVELDCSSNNLTSLNISSNTSLSVLSCNLNDIISLDLSTNTALTSLSCDGNDLTNLDLSSNSSLNYLACNYNDLTSLDLTNNTALTYLSCFANSLNSLNISTCTILTDLYCDNNSLTTLDISNNTLLQHLQIHSNNLTELDTYNNTLLEDITCQENNIGSLDLSNNTQLWFLWCYNNNIGSLDLSNNSLLSELRCQFNNIGSLDLSNNTALTFVMSQYNNLSFFDIKNGTNDIITYFSVLNNPDLYCIQVDDASYSNVHWPNLDAQSYYSDDCYSTLTYIPDNAFEQALINLGYDDVLDNYVLTANIDSVTNLYVAFLGINDLTGIKDFTNLSILTCNNNNLTALDLSNNLALTDLIAYANNLTSLNLSNNTALTRLSCATNSLTSLNVKNGNNYNMTPAINFVATDNPDLYCIEVDDPVWSLANWSFIDPQSYFDQNCSLSIEDEVLPEIVIYPNPVSYELTIDLQNIVELKQVSVYSLSGQLVLQSNHININLGGLGAGFYILQIETNKGITSKKLIKN